MPRVAATPFIAEPGVLMTNGFAEEGSLLDAEALGELTATLAAPAIANVVGRATCSHVPGLRVTAETPLQVFERSTGSAAPEAGRTRLWG